MFEIGIVFSSNWTTQTFIQSIKVDDKQSPYELNPRPAIKFKGIIK